MFALDLFNTPYEKELQEGAVDNTVARLIEPLSLRAAEIRTQLRNGNLKGSEMAALEKEYEDLVAKRLDIIHGRKPATQDECMGYGGLGEAGLPDVADKQAKMSRLNQPGRAGTDVVTSQQRVNPNPDKGIIGHAKDWLTGKGGLGKEGPTYESELDEQDAPATVAQGIYNEMIRAWQDEKDYIVLPFPDSHNATLTRPQLWNALVTLGQVTPNRRAKYVESKFNDFETFMRWASQLKRYKVPPKQKKNAQMDLGIQPAAVAPTANPQTPVAEAQKKNSEEPDLTGNTAQDASVQRELQRVRARHPAARSDIEALVKDEIVNQERVNQEIERLETIDSQQDDKLNQVLSLNTQQEAEITRLNQQLASLDGKLNQALGRAPAATPTTAPTKQAAEPTQPGTVSAPAPVSAPTTEPGSTAEPVADKSAAEIARLEKQIQQLELVMTLKTPAQQDDLRDRIDALEKERDAKIEKQQAATAKGVATRKANKAKAAAAVATDTAAKTASKEKPADDELPFKGKGQAPGMAGISAMAGSNKSTAKSKYQKGGHDYLSDILSGAGKEHLTPDEQDREVKFDPAELAEVDEGQLGQATPHAIYIDNQLWRVYADSKTALDMEKKVKASLKAQGRDQQVKVSPYYQGISEGFQDFGKKEPYAVCLAGKPVKKFDYYEDARRFHDNWKKKLYREGDKAKADKITLMPLNLKEFAPGGGSISPPTKPPKNDGDRWEDEDDDDQWHPRKRTEEDLHNPLGDQIKALLKKKAKIVWYPWADREQDTQHRTQAVIRQVTKEQIIDGRHIVFFKYCWRPWYKTAKGMELGGWRCDQSQLPPNAHKYLALGPVGSGTYELQDLAKNPDWKDPRSPEEIEWQRRLDDLDEASKQGVAEDTGSWIVYDPETKQIKKRFKTHTAGKSYAQTHGLGFASSEHYFDRVKPAVTTEGIVASGPSQPLDDRAIRKMVWDTMKINADTGEQALQRALAVLAKKPQSRMVQDLQDKFQSLADRLSQGVTETVTDVRAEMARVYRRLAPKIERYRDSFLAGQLYDELENLAELHGAEAEFKRMMAGARNRAHMDYDTNPGGFQNWFWYLPFADDELNEVKEIRTREDFLRERDRLYRLVQIETDPASKQIIRTEIRNLERRAAEEGWVKFVNEESSTSSDAVERAILHRIMVDDKLRNMAMDVGMDKVFQAVEEVAYNVGDVDEIGSSDVSGWIHQVKQILGAE